MLRKVKEFFTWLLHSERTVSERYEVNFKEEPRIIDRKGKNWSEYETNIACTMWESDKSLEDIALILTRTKAAVRHKLISQGYSTAKEAPRYKALIMEEQ